MTATRVPVTLLTGYLGAGNTTVLNQVLAQRHQERIAVVENEFGRIGIDAALVGSGACRLWELTCGCLCCDGRGNLVEALVDAVSGAEGTVTVDRIIVETTGLADPGPVAQALLVDERLKARLYLDAVVTVLDAKHIVAQLDEPRPAGIGNEAMAQVELADRLVVTKADLVSEPELAAVLNRVTAVNRWAEILLARGGSTPIGSSVSAPSTSGGCSTSIRCCSPGTTTSTTPPSRRSASSWRAWWIPTV